MLLQRQRAWITATNNSTIGLATDSSTYSAAGLSYQYSVGIDMLAELYTTEIVPHKYIIKGIKHIKSSRGFPARADSITKQLPSWASPFSWPPFSLWQLWWSLLGLSFW